MVFIKKRIKTWEIWESYIFLSHYRRIDWICMWWRYCCIPMHVFIFRISHGITWQRLKWTKWQQSVSKRFVLLLVVITCYFDSWSEIQLTLLLKFLKTRTSRLVEQICRSLRWISRYNSNYIDIISVRKIMYKKIVQQLYIIDIHNVRYESCW